MTDTIPMPEGSPNLPQKKNRLPLIIGGLVLLLILVGLGGWLVLRPKGPDYAADCAVIEKTAPEFGADLAGMMQRDPGSMTSGLDNVDSAADTFRKIADQLTDKEFAADLNAGADNMDKFAKGIQSGDFSVMSDMQDLVTMGTSIVSFLDTHCDRWLGPGEWGEPGTKPSKSPKEWASDMGESLSSTMPTGAPTEVPSAVTTTMPTEVPTMGDLGSMDPNELQQQLDDLQQQMDDLEAPPSP